MAFCGVQGREWRGSILGPHMLQSQRPDPIEKASHTIRSRCACVWNFCGWNSHPPFAELSLLSFAEIWAVFHFSFFFFFFSCFLGHRHLYFFLLFFYIAQIFLHDEYKEFCQKRNGAFLWMEGIYLRNFQCRSQHMSGWVHGVYVILILKIWSESHKDHKEFDNAQCKHKQHMYKCFKCVYMALVGI